MVCRRLIGPLLLLAVAAGAPWTAPALAAQRTFHLGFTPFPYDATIEARETTFDLVNSHSDIVAHHFDNGVPWVEAYRGEEYSESALSEYGYRLGRLVDTQKVYLAVTPINNLRDGLAAYWGERENMERPGAWKRRKFDHPKVIQAFTNHCLFMIERFQPDYFAYAVEVDLFAAKRPKAYQRFLKLAEEVYAALKERYPELPVFATLTVADESALEERRGFIEQILPFTDYLAISTYPYLAGHHRPRTLPGNWLTKLRDVAPEKPFAVAETGFNAETLELPSFGITIPGKRKWQAAYVKWLFRELNRLDAEFVIWFVAVDYDELWELMEAAGVTELFKAWRDTGLWNSNLKPRKARRIWRKWLQRQLAG